MRSLSQAAALDNRVPLGSAGMTSIPADAVAVQGQLTGLDQ